MQAKQHKRTHLKDYQAPQFEIESLSLRFELAEHKTRVTAVQKIRKVTAESEVSLCLDGVKLKLISIKLDSVVLMHDAYQVSDAHLIIHAVPDQFALEIETEIYPQNNTELTGLYKTKTLFCTQCEATGFRRITYFLDRPDVLTCYTTTIIADKEKYPILLSNGNLVEQGQAPDPRQHYATWHDPFKKPSYLFALVAGDLEVAQDEFITCSGRAVSLQMFVDKGNLSKCDYALSAAKKAMRWDETTYGREYDLDIYMIVAVDDFNMGAMENKGLNIFNSKYVLANLEIATDQDFAAILDVVSHEYFHNWTGNRVTCRDWFQLSLKEGLTIFREQEFVADMTSHAVKRIQDARHLRCFQFAEAKGPMAHAVQPESYLEINNFYTHTVYEKGAEVIRMLQTLLSKAGFRKGMDLYFQRHDGQAVTIEAFVKAMEDANAIDLKQFRLWYKQIATPELDISLDYTAAQKQVTLKVKQMHPEKGRALLVPMKLSLLTQKGDVIKLRAQKDPRVADHEFCLTIADHKQEFVFNHVMEKPILSLQHDFCAPITLNYTYSKKELAVLVAYSPNAFARWEALQTYYFLIFEKLIKNYQYKRKLVLPQKFCDVVASNLEDTHLADPHWDASYLAELLQLPDMNYIISMRTESIDIEAIYHVEKFMRQQLASKLKSQFLALYTALHQKEDYQITAEAMARRKLKNTALHYLLLLQEPKFIQLAQQQYQKANNMTDRIVALKVMLNTAIPQRKTLLQDFYQRWQHEALVVDKWFSLQAAADHADVFADLKQLLQHPDFNLKNPNRVRSLLGTFCHNNPYFHRPDGAAYVLLSDYVIKLDTLNPQLATRLVEPLIHWQRYDAKRQALQKAQLTRIIETADLSNDLYEVVSKAL